MNIDQNLFYPSESWNLFKLKFLSHRRSSINSVNELLNVIFKLDLFTSLTVNIDGISNNSNIQREYFDKLLINFNFIEECKIQFHSEDKMIWIDGHHGNEQVESADFSEEKQFLQETCLHRELTNSWLSIFRGSVRGISWAYFPVQTWFFRVLSAVFFFLSVRFQLSFRIKTSKTMKRRLPWDFEEWILGTLVHLQSLLPF